MHKQDKTSANHAQSYINTLRDGSVLPRTKTLEESIRPLHLGTEWVYFLQVTQVVISNNVIMDFSLFQLNELRLGGRGQDFPTLRTLNIHVHALLLQNRIKFESQRPCIIHVWGCAKKKNRGSYSSGTTSRTSNHINPFSSCKTICVRCEKEKRRRARALIYSCIRAFV